MTDPEYLVLSEWFNYLISAPQLDFHVDEIIYLRTDPEVAHERIKNRHRHEEMKIPLQYLKGMYYYINNNILNSIFFKCSILLTRKVDF